MVGGYRQQCLSVSRSPDHVRSPDHPMSYAAPTSWITKLASGSFATACVTRCCAASRVYNPGSAIRPATLSNPSTILMTKYCFTYFTSAALTRVEQAAPWAHPDAGLKPGSTLFFTSLLLLVHVNVLGVDHAFIFLFLTCAAVPLSAGWSACCFARLRLRRFVHGFRQLVRGLRQPVPGRVHDGRVRTLQRLLGVRQG